MHKSVTRTREVIPEELIRARLAQSEEMREFYIQMWLQNPELAKQGGQKVQDLLSPLDYSCHKDAAYFSGMIKQRGVSLVELIMFIVIISVALVGISLVMNQVTRHSADPLVHKQAMAIAESLLEEIQLQDFVSQDGTTHNCVTPNTSPCVTAADRSTAYHVVQDYNGFRMTGISDISGSAISGLGNYSAEVGIVAEALGSASSAVRITITVTDPQANTIAIDGYRTSY
jgi:MSHA pilin protein MshD